MATKKVLIVTQDMKPFTSRSIISDIALQLPRYAFENKMEIRILMPKFGTINERRHRLHEVVRLSGMNIIIAEGKAKEDYPLVIKVATIPNIRMQVYFLDNEDFFKRKAIFEDADGKPFKDNVSRMVFFCKGVMETIKKFAWAPDIVHCHGWMTSLIPFYLKSAYKNEPVFSQSKVIYSVYGNSLDRTFETENFINKASINNLTEEELAVFKKDGGISLHNGALHHADAATVGSDTLQNGVVELLENLDKPVHSYTEPEIGSDTKENYKTNKKDFLPAYLDFYTKVIEA